MVHVGKHTSPMDFWNGMILQEPAKEKDPYSNGKLRIPIVRMMVNSIKGYNPIYPYIYLLYHLESRWRNSHVLVYHSPLPSHLLGVAQSTFTTVYMGGSISSPYHPPKPGPASFNAFSFRFASEIMWFKPGVWSVGHGLSWWVGEPSHPKVWAIFFFSPNFLRGNWTNIWNK